MGKGRRDKRWGELNERRGRQDEARAGGEEQSAINEGRALLDKMDVPAPACVDVWLCPTTERRYRRCIQAKKGSSYCMINRK